MNDAPIANNDSATTLEDNAVSISILSNDSDIDGSVTTNGITITSGVSNGSTSINTSNGNVTYTPDTNFNGSDSFSYTVLDNQGLASNTATVSITVSSVNDSPVAANDSGTTDEDNAVTINLLSNDSDSDGSIDSSSVVITSNPANGNVSLSSGSATYTPNANLTAAIVPLYR